MGTRVSRSWLISFLLFMVVSGCKARAAKSTSAGADDDKEAPTMRAKPLPCYERDCSASEDKEQLLSGIFGSVVNAEQELIAAPSNDDPASGTSLSLQDPKTATEEQRLQLMLEQLRRETEGHREAVQKNPNLEFKSVKCNQPYEHMVGEAGSGVRVAETVNHSVVVFFSTIGEDTARSHCAATIKSPAVGGWFNTQNRSDGINGTFDEWHGRAITYEAVRNHGFDVIERDFPSIVKAKDGKVSYITSYFSVQWFNCIYRGKGCRKNWYAAKVYCEQQGGRLATMADYLVIHDEIAQHEGYSEEPRTYWMEGGAKKIAGTMYYRVFQLGSKTFSYVELPKDRYLYCVRL